MPAERWKVAAGVAGGVVGLGVLLLASRRAHAPAMVTAPPDSAPTNAEQHRQARPILTKAFRRVVGRDPTLAEIQYAHGVAWLETNYGRGWKGAMQGANNWGAVQCPKSAVSGYEDEAFALTRNVLDANALELVEHLSALGTGFTVGAAGSCIEYQDGFADGTKYTVSFRAYPTPVDGAVDVIRHVFKLRPRTAAALASHGASVSRASFAMRREKYYEGFCPAATKQYGGSSVRPSLAHPDRDAATRACAREAGEAHAKRIASIIATVAGACGDPVALGLGSFDEADAWYRATYPDAGPGAPGTDATTKPPAAAMPSAVVKPPTPASSSSSSAAPSSPKASVPGLAGRRLVEAVLSGTIEPPTWIEVPWKAAGVVLRVSADALQAPIDGKLVRLPVTWLDTKEIAHRLDCVPLTQEVSDLIWAAASIKIDPRPLGKWDTDADKKASSEGQRSLDWSRRFSASIDSQIAGRTGLVADVGKDWILSPRLLLGPALGVTYGWRYVNGKLIQGAGPDDVFPRHNDAHYDYSQTMRLVQRTTVDGQDVLAVYRARGVPQAVIDLFGKVPS